MATKRNLFRLIDDPHSAPADLAKHAIVAQLFEMGDRDCPVLLRIHRLVGQGDVLHHRHRRKHLADLVGQVGVPIDIFLEGRPLPRAITLEEFLGQLQHQPGARFGIRRRHRDPPLGND